MIGTGLFDFGFKDGVQGQALLQHPLGVFAESDGEIFIADSYNQAIRRFDVKSGKLETLSGSGKRGYQDGSFETALFAEPASVLKVGEKLYVADTNNHQIRVLDLKTKQVSTLVLHTSSAHPQDKKPAEYLPRLKATAPLTLQAGKKIQLKITFALRMGDQQNSSKPDGAFSSRGESATLISEFTHEQLITKRVELPPFTEGKHYRLQATFYYCRHGQGSVCEIQSRDTLIEASRVGAGEIEIQLAN